MVRLHNKYSRVHTIGVGDGCSEQLILGCALKGRGSHTFIGDNQDPSEKIIQLLADSLSPVISDVKVNFDKEVVESIVPNPQSMPYILKNQLVNFYITFKGELKQQTEISFSYEDSLNKLPYNSVIKVDPQSESDSFVDRMGNFKRIRALEDAHNYKGNIHELMFCSTKLQLKEEAIKQSIRHQILSEFTAFICVQKELIDGRYHEVKGTEKLKVIMESPESTKKKRQNPVVKYAKRQPESRARSSEVSRCKKKCKSKMVEQRVSCKKSSVNLESFDNGVLNQQLQAYKMFSPFFSGFPKVEPSLNKTFALQKKAFEASEAMDIRQLVSLQCTDGSWKDFSILNKIFKSNIEEIVRKQQNSIEILTYLITKWIEKYYSEKQYSLVAKKGRKFVEKTDSIDRISRFFDKYLQ